MVTTIHDLRRTDIRRQTLQNPYWISSGIIDKDAVGLDAVLFSFPITADAFSPGYKPFFITQCVTEIIIAFDGTAAITVGTATLLTNPVTTGGAVSIVNADEFHLADDITDQTIGYYPSSLTGTDSAWSIALILHVCTYPTYVVPIDDAVPTVYAALTEGGTIAVGAARVHLCINEVP